MNVVDIKPDTPEIKTCEKHGDYEVVYHPYITEGKYMAFDSCPVCAKEAKIRDEQEKADNLAKLKLERMAIAKQEAGLRVRHLDCSFENFETETPGKQNALQMAQDYLSRIIAGKGSCLIMSGSVGTGKTHLASAMINAYITIGRSSKIIKMLELCRDIKTSWGRASIKNEKELIEYYSTRDLLIIDEIGVQYGSENEKLLISDIIDNRYQHCLPTVLISNLDVDGIRRCIGDRSYDRLKEDGGKVIAFDWESARRQDPEKLQLSR